jgi:drug/metabolite transporter (DMT)-like permease
MTKKDNSPALVGASYIVISSFFYASYGIWTKLMGNFFGGYTASAWRSLVVLLMLVPIAYFYRKLEKVNFRRNWKYLLSMTIASFFIWGPLYYAVLHAGIGISLAIAYASIVIGMFFFGSLLNNEKLTNEKIVSALLGFVGLAFVFSPTLHALGWLALGGAFISGFATSANMLITKKIKYNPTQATVWLWITSAIANFVMALVISEKSPEYGFYIQWFYLIIFAIASIIASWCFVKGLRYVDAGIAGILGLLEVVFAVLFGGIFFNEHPSGMVQIGILIILIAAAIPNLRTLALKF